MISGGRDGKLWKKLQAAEERGKGEKNGKRWKKWEVVEEIRIKPSNIGNDGPQY